MEQREQEQSYLYKVKTALEKEIAALRMLLNEKEKEIVNMKQYYWENANEFDEYKYEDYTNRQMIEEELNAAEERLKKIHLYEKMLASPYFGSIDFLYDGEDDAERYYIGMGNFYPDKKAMPLVCDWRAPIAGLYYDYDKGPAKFQSPNGTIEGEILHKYQYKISNGELEYFFENDMKIDDGILQKELGSAHADSRLKSIVATIQREQNQIIRNEKDKVLIVQGAAGSGKTSIALHRIAYLLYHKREELKAEEVLILSPNTVFADYISAILPELGEENIKEMSFDEFASKELRELCKIENKYEYLEYLLCEETSTFKKERRQERMAKKESRAYLEELNAFALSLEMELVEFQDISYKKMSRTADELADAFYNKFPDIPLLQRLSAVADYIIDEEETKQGHDMDPIEAEVLKNKIEALYETKNVLDLYNHFLQEQGEAPFMRDKRLPYEDVYPLLYLKYLLCGTNTYKHIKHLVVDEMQDYSVIQFALLRMIFSCPMTILGDREQAIDGKPSEILSILKETFGKKMRLIELKKSYRQTIELAKFAANILHTEGIEYLERHGEAPRIHRMQNKNELKAKLWENLKKQAEQNMHETIAVLCLTKWEAKQCFEELQKEFAVSLLEEDTAQFPKGIVVTTFYLAKGLEFDAVHVVDAKLSEDASYLHKQAMYICATRALHELDLYERFTWRCNTSSE